MSHEPEQWAPALTAAHHQPPRGVVPERVGNDEPMGTTNEQEEMAPMGRGQGSPACTQMATPDENEVGYMEWAQSGLRGEELLDTEEVSVKCGVSARFSPGLHEGPCLDRWVRDQRAGGVRGILPPCRI